MAGFTSLVSYFLLLVRRFLNSAWIRFNQTVCYPDRVVPRSTETSHKVLVIGDSLALGLGAWPLPGSKSGVAPHLLRCAGLDRARVRQYWTVVNQGGGGSCTEDWMPPGKEELAAGEPTTEESSSSSPLVPPSKTGGASWSRTFSPSRTSSDAEIVVILLGLSDICRNDACLPLHAMKRDHTSASAPYPEDELAQVVKNLRAIATRLLEMGKKVAIVDYPTTGAVVSKYGEGKVKRINRQIKQIIRRDLSQVSKDAANPVAYVQLGQNSKVLRPENRAYDSLHLTTAGYKALAVEIYDKIVPMMVNVEWTSWKEKLKGKLPEHERAMKASEEELVGLKKKQ